ncbi:MAG: hypothetical protein WC047_00055 [Kiritimatiellales bacterium]
MKYTIIRATKGGSPVTMTSGVASNTSDKEIVMLVELEGAETYAGILSSLPPCQPGSTVYSTEYFTDPTDAAAFTAMKKPSGTWSYA